MSLCPAYIRSGNSGPWGCIHPRGHEGKHEDVNGNTWPPTFVLPPEDMQKEPSRQSGD